MDAFHNYEHHCPNCRVIIGKSTPDDRDVERKKGLKVVVGALIGSIICAITAIVLVIVFVILNFTLITSFVHGYLGRFC